MLAQHMGVNVPPPLLSEVGHLLNSFETYLSSLGYASYRDPKLDGGNQITPWWLRVVLHADAPAKRKVTIRRDGACRREPAPTSLGPGQGEVQRSNFCAPERFHAGRGDGCNCRHRAKGARPFSMNRQSGRNTTKSVASSLSCLQRPSGSDTFTKVDIGGATQQKATRSSLSERHCCATPRIHM